MSEDAAAICGWLELPFRAGPIKRRADRTGGISDNRGRNRVLGGDNRGYIALLNGGLLGCDRGAAVYTLVIYRTVYNIKFSQFC